MNQEYNIYCDESCHQINDGSKCMVLGALMIPKEKVKLVSDKIKSLKCLYDMNIHNEIKWTKVSPNRFDLYKSIIGLFVSDPSISFRCVVVPDKSLLKHEQYARTHDNFYYIMYYYGLKFLLNQENRYNIYFDYKDTCQHDELTKLKIYLHNYTEIPLADLKLQPVLSFESQMIQLCDILTGAVSYANRGLCESKAKSSIVHLIMDATKQTLVTSSPTREAKFNVFVWTAKDLKDKDA